MVCIYFTCLCFCLYVYLCKGVSIPWNWSYRQLGATMGVLGTELGTSWRTVSALNHWAIFPAQFCVFLQDRGMIQMSWEIMAWFQVEQLTLEDRGGLQCWQVMWFHHGDSCRDLPHKSSLGSLFLWSVLPQPPPPLCRRGFLFLIPPFLPQIPHLHVVKPALISTENTLSGLLSYIDLKELSIGLSRICFYFKDNCLELVSEIFEINVWYLNHSNSSIPIRTFLFVLTEWQ